MYPYYYKNARQGPLIGGLAAPITDITADDTNPSTLQTITFTIINTGGVATSGVFRPDANPPIPDEELLGDVVLSDVSNGATFTYTYSGGIQSPYSPRLSLANAAGSTGTAVKTRTDYIVVRLPSTHTTPLTTVGTDSFNFEPGSINRSVECYGLGGDGDIATGGGGGGEYSKSSGDPFTGGDGPYVYTIPAVSSAAPTDFGGIVIANSGTPASLGGPGPGASGGIGDVTNNGGDGDLTGGGGAGGPDGKGQNASTTGGASGGGDAGAGGNAGQDGNNFGGGAGLGLKVGGAAKIIVRQDF